MDGRLKPTPLKQKRAALPLPPIPCLPVMATQLLRVRAEDRGRLATTALTIFCTLNRQRLPSSQLPRVQAVAPAVVPLPSQLSTLPLGVCAGKVHLKGQHFNPGAGCYYYFRL